MAIVSRLLGPPKNTEIVTSEGLDRLLRRGAPAWSGMEVSASSAVEISTVFACVRVIAEDIGKLPFPVYARGGDGAKERATGSPFWKLIHDRPNGWQTSQEFREFMTASALLRGNGYALKNVVAGQVRELLPLHPTQVRVEQLPDFEVVYHVRLADGRERQLSRREVFHLRGLSFDGVAGVPVVTLARHTFGLAMAQERHAGTFFANGMQPGGVFEHPETLGDEALKHLKESLQDATTGANAHNPLILEEGMKWHGISLTNEDSQFLESRQFGVPEICRWFRVAPHKVADLSRAHFTNIESQNLDHVTDTLMPWAKRWENAFNGQVIAGSAVYAELLFDALLRGTTKDRYQAYQLAAGGNAPWMTRNEIRVLENRNPLPGLDEILTPLNMGADGEERDDHPDEGAAADRPPAR